MRNILTGFSAELRGEGFCISVLRHWLCHCHEVWGRRTFYKGAYCGVRWEGFCGRGCITPSFCFCTQQRLAWGTRVIVFIDLKKGNPDWWWGEKEHRRNGLAEQWIRMTSVGPSGEAGAV